MKRLLVSLFMCTASLLPAAAYADPTISAAGDVACASSVATSTSCRQQATSDLLSASTAVITLGDGQYNDGTLSEYNAYYAPSWGRFKSITYPAPGNHDYDNTGGGAGYFSYFSKPSYYSFDVGAWHLISLDGEISHGAGSTQEQWLKDDLAANTSQCTLAYWHEPRFTSGTGHSSDSSFDPFWRDLYAARAEVVLNGHVHNYERFRKQTPDQTVDTTYGIREFVVGTGGSQLYASGTPIKNSVYQASRFGVLQLTLHSKSYDWAFARDDGTTQDVHKGGKCFGADSSPTPPPPSSTTIPTSGSPVRGMYDRDSSATGFDDQAALGFNYIDSGASKSQMDALAARNLKGTVWLGDYDNTTCTNQRTDAEITTSVSSIAGNPGVGTYLIADEPDPYACPNAPAQLKARSDLVKSIDPGKPTLIVMDANSGQTTLSQMPLWKNTADVIGLDPYPCYVGKACNYPWIDAVANAADQAGLRYWAVIQAFGDSTWKLPTPAELHQQFLHWRATKMEGYLIFAWHWPTGNSSLWLANHSELQSQLATENAL